MFCYGVYVLSWSMYSAVEYTFCCGVHVLLWSTYSAVEYMFCCAVYVRLWSICSTVEHIFCYGVYILLWSICSAVEYMFCCGAYVLPWSICSAAEHMFLSILLLLITQIPFLPLVPGFDYFHRLKGKALKIITLLLSWFFCPIGKHESNTLMVPSIVSVCIYDSSTTEKIFHIALNSTNRLVFLIKEIFVLCRLS